MKRAKSHRLKSQRWNDSTSTHGGGNNGRRSTERKREENRNRENRELQRTKEALIVAFGPFDGEVAYELTYKKENATTAESVDKQGVSDY